MLSCSLRRTSRNLCRAFRLCRLINGNLHWRIWFWWCLSLSLWRRSLLALLRVRGSRLFLCRPSSWELPLRWRRGALLVCRLDYRIRSRGVHEWLWFGWRGPLFLRSSPLLWWRWWCWLVSFLGLADGSNHARWCSCMSFLRHIARVYIRHDGGFVARMRLGLELFTRN